MNSATSSPNRYRARIRPDPTKPRAEAWTTFFKNHARDIVAVDMFVVPTIRFQVLYIFIILDLERRRLILANVTANPTADWLVGACRKLRSSCWRGMPSSSSAPKVRPA